MKRTYPIAALVLALFVAACGTDATDATADLPVNSGNNAQTCIAGDPDCQDLGPQGSDDEPLFVDGEPVDGPPVDDTQSLPNGSLTIPDVLSSNIDGGFAITGFYVDDGSGPMLCDALLESFPPQCGGDSIPVDNSAGVELDGLRTDSGVTWTDQPAVLVGEVIDGTFVVTPISG